MFDYETLRFIWWLLIGVILVVFMISDGFDMGIVFRLLCGDDPGAVLTVLPPAGL